MAESHDRTLIPDALDLAYEAQQQKMAKATEPIQATASATPVETTMSQINTPQTPPSMATEDQIRKMVERAMAQQDSHAELVRMYRETLTGQHTASQAHASAQAESNRLRDELQAASKQNETHTAALATAQAKITELNSQLEAKSKTLTETQAQLAEATKAVAASKKQEAMAARKAKIAGTKMPETAKAMLTRFSLAETPDGTLAMSDAVFDAELATAVELHKDFQPTAPAGATSAPAATTPAKATAEGATPPPPQVPGTGTGTAVLGTASLTSGVIAGDGDAKAAMTKEYANKFRM